jgi:hypothetical protein
MHSQQLIFIKEIPLAVQPSQHSQVLLHLKRYCTPIGTATIRAVEPETTATLTQFIVGINQHSYGRRDFLPHDVKSMGYDNGMPFIFSGDLYLDIVEVSGLISTVDSGGNTDITGSGTLFTQQFSVNDYIYTTRDTNGIPQLHRIISITDDVTMTVAGNMGTTTTTPFWNTKTPIWEPEKLSAVFKIAHGPVRSIRSSDDTTLGKLHSMASKQPNAIAAQFRPR